MSSKPLTVVTWKWSVPGYRSDFCAEHVNVLRRMVARHYSRPHRFCCVTNEPEGLDPQVEVIPDASHDTPGTAVKGRVATASE